MSATPIKQRFLLRAVSAAGALGLLGGLLSVTPAYAAPAKADLIVTAAANPAEVTDLGGGTTVTVDVRNAGGAGREFTLALTLPAGAWIPGDGVVIPPSWHCDLTATATCTHAALAAGAADRLSLPIGLPADTAGRTVTVSATATMRGESSIANNTGRATITYVPSTVDLVFSSVATDEEMVEGDRYYAAPAVTNAGTRTSEEVTLTIPVPAGLTDSAVTPTEGWSCAFDDSAAPQWRCTHAPMAPGESSFGPSLAATVSGVAPGDVINVTVRVSTTSPESDLGNNTQTNTIRVMQAATVRGTVWVDQPRNGVRDATDPGAPPGPAGVDQVVLDSREPGRPSVIATVNADGTYTARAVPGTYRVEFYVYNYNYTFFDSPDSDLAYYINYDGGIYAYGYTDWFTVAGGDDVTLDAGVQSRYCPC
jgi:hypothetical protein